VADRPQGRRGPIGLGERSGCPHTRKSPEAGRHGYRAHVADPETGIITDEKLTKAADQENSDPAVAAEFVTAETAETDGAATPGQDVPDLGRSRRNGGDGALAWYGDSA
jgi:hypothetical protein